MQAPEARDAGAQRYLSTATALLESRRIAVATMSTPVRGAGDIAALYEMDADVDGEGEGDMFGGAAAPRASEQLWHSQRRTQADLLAANEVCLCCGWSVEVPFLSLSFFKQV